MILFKDRGKGAGSSRQYSLIQNLIFLQIEDGIGKECDLGGNFRILVKVFLANQAGKDDPATNFFSIKQQDLIDTQQSS